jgi:uncharacterized DUF497 family protein
LRFSRFVASVLYSFEKKRMLWLNPPNRFPSSAGQIPNRSGLQVIQKRITFNHGRSPDRMGREQECGNRRKHGIGFETARFVFADPKRLWRIDRSEGNTSGEERWQSLGMAEGVVFVVYTEREAEGVNETRLITARLANKTERRSYNGHYRIDNKGWSKAD